VPSTTEHLGCRTGFGRRGGNAISLQIIGGRTWIRTTDLFLVRHVMPGMQEEAAEKIDAGLRAALAS